MLKIKRLFSLFLMVTLIISTVVIMPNRVSANTIAPYAMPSVYTASTVYSLKLNNIQVPIANYNGDYDYANLSMSVGTTTVEVTVTGASSITSYSISPKKLNLTGSTSGNKLTFTISKDEYLIVQINGLKRLVIAADPGEVGAPASSGAGIFNVTAAPFNADKTGSTLTTAAIQSAIDAASAYNNGIVYVPAGVYTIGNLVLKSNMKLYLQSGAVLYASIVKTDYTMNWHKDSINKDVTWWISTQVGADNIKVYGRGIIDGRGTSMPGFASNLLVPMGCTNFTCEGILFRDSSAWAVTPVRSNDLTFTNMKIFNRFSVGEDDGIDVCESQNVTVTNSIGIGLDDPYTTKSWTQTTDISKNWPGSPEVVSNVTFDDCISWTFCYGYKVGQGVLQNQTGITFKNSVVYDSAVGIGVHHKYGTGTVSAITFDNIDIEKVSNTNDGHRTWLHMEVLGGTNGVGPINGVNIKNINVRDQGTSGGILKGYDSTSQISNTTFDNIKMPNGSVARNLSELNITNKAFYNGYTVLPTQISEPILTNSYEAEGGALSNGATIITSTNGSGGKKVGNIGGTSNGRCSITVNVASAGTKTLTIYYASAENRTFYVTVNTGGYVAVACPSTGAWDTIGTKTMTVNLNAGNNTILFNNGTGAWTPDLDRISIN